MTIKNYLLFKESSLRGAKRRGNLKGIDPVEIAASLKNAPRNDTWVVTKIRSSGLILLAGLFVGAAHATPTAITDLSATSGTAEGSIVLSWTAPAGGATEYIIKYRFNDLIVTSADFIGSTRIEEPPLEIAAPTPASSGQTETFLIEGLEPGAIYAWSIKSADSGGNRSPLSNSATAQATVPCGQDPNDGKGAGALLPATLQAGSLTIATMTFTVDPAGISTGGKIAMQVPHFSVDPSTAVLTGEPGYTSFSNTGGAVLAITSIENGKIVLTVMSGSLASGDLVKIYYTAFTCDSGSTLTFQVFSQKQSCGMLTEIPSSPNITTINGVPNFITFDPFEVVTLINTIASFELKVKDACGHPATLTANQNVDLATYRYDGANFIEDTFAELSLSSDMSSPSTTLSTSLASGASGKTIYYRIASDANQPNYISLQYNALELPNDPTGFWAPVRPLSSGITNSSVDSDTLIAGQKTVSFDPGKNERAYINFTLPENLSWQIMFSADAFATVAKTIYGYGDSVRVAWDGYTDPGPNEPPAIAAPADYAVRIDLGSNIQDNTCTITLSANGMQGSLVQAGTSTPIDGADIEFFGPTSRYMRSQSDGTFTMYGLDSGNYTVRIHKFGYSFKEVNAVVGTGITNLGSVGLDQDSILQVYLSRPSASALPDLTGSIRAYTSDYSQQAYGTVRFRQGKTTSDAGDDYNGTPTPYTNLSLAPNVLYNVTIEVPSYAVDEFQVTLNNSEIRSSTRTLTRQPTVEGNVTLPTSGNPNGKWVSVEAAVDANSDLVADSDDPSDRYFGGVYLPPDELSGIYRVFGLPNNTYLLTAQTEGFVRAKINATVAGSDVSGADFPTLSEGGNFSGTLRIVGDSTLLDPLDGSNDGFVSVYINAFSPTTGQGSFGIAMVPEHASDSSAAYQIKGLEDGTYSVFIYMPGYGLNPPGPKSVAVSGGTGSLDLTLERFTGQISGSIILPAADTAYNTVEIDVLSFSGSPDGGSPPTAVITGSNFSIDNLGTGFYSLRARYPTTGLVVTQGVQVSNGLTTSRNIDLSGATYSVSGRVSSSASAPYTLDYLVNGSTPTLAYTPIGGTTLSANRITATRLRGRNFNQGQGSSSAGFFYDPKETYIGTYNATDGSYSISGLSPGAYRLTSNGEIDGDFSNGNEISQSQLIVNISNQNLTDKDFTLTDGFTVSGTIRVASGQSESGRGLLVQLLDSTGESAAQAYVILTGSSVDFSLSKIRPGNYVLSAMDSFPRKYSSKDTSVQVIASDVTDKEITLLNSSIIKGRLLVKKSGIVISPINFSQYLPDDFSIEARSNPPIPGGFSHAEDPIIDNNGYFNIQVNPGTYDVVLRSFGFIGDSAIAQGKKQFVPVTKSGVRVGDNEVKDLGFISLNEGIEMTGTVLDAQGTVLPNVLVRAEHAKNTRDDNSIQSYTDADGQYVLHGIDSDETRFYNITAAPRPDPFDPSSPGDTSTVKYGQVTKGPIDTRTTTAVNFVLEGANSTIVATVATTDGGDPVVPFGESGAENLPGFIAILNKQPDIPRSNPIGDILEQGSADGSLSVKGLSAGVYDMTILAGGYGSIRKKNISVGANATVDLGTLTLPAGFTLFGKITKSNGDLVTRGELESIIAARDNFNEISMGKFESDASGNILKYSITGIQASKAYSVLGLGRANKIVSLTSNITITSDTELDLVFPEPTPGILTQSLKNQDGTFTLIYKFDAALRNSDIIDDDAILTLTTGGGTLSAATISSDRREAEATYTPAAGETSFVVTVDVTFVAENATTGENQTASQAFTYYIGIARQNSVTLTNASGGDVDLSQASDGSGFTAAVGFLGDDDDASAEVTLLAATTLGDLNISAASSSSRLGALRIADRLGMQAYPSDMAAAMQRLKGLDVSPFSSFYDVFLPVGVSHFFPEGKEARLCLTYDSSVTDPSTLNIYYYNSATNEYLLESENKSIDTDNEKICVNISHASVFTVLSSSVSIISGGSYTGELTIINFPNPFNLKQKTVTLQNPGSASASQTIQGTMIKMSIPSTMAGTVEIQIFNVAGELVRTLNTSVTGGAHYYLEWDGMNERGQKVASGTYIARFTVGGSNEKFFKMAVLK